MSDILYRSRRLEVRRVAAGDGSRQVITFDSYHEPAGLERPGFGEAFFRTEGITATHVMSHGNDWFQYTEIPSLLSVIRRNCAGAKRLLCYGSSMGGYAAIRFAGQVGAHAALALSPQYSLDRRRVPFETRWLADQRRIRFRKEVDGKIRAAPLTVIAYDSALEADRLHAELFAAETGALLLPLAQAGHPAGAFLNDMALLRPLVLRTLDGSLEQERFLRAVRRRRGGSAHRLATLAERQPAWRNGCALAFARRAAELAPDHTNLLDAYARRLAAAGRYDDAIAAHERAIAIEPIVDYLWGFSKTLFAAGELGRALAVAQHIQELAPTAAGYHAWAASLREAKGDIRGSLADLERAVRHDRSNLAYRYRLWQSRLAGWSALFRR